MSKETTKRQYTLGIWGLTLGYFLFYIPYSGFSKAITSGLLTGGHVIPGAEVLPGAAVATAIAVFIFITFMSWWRYGRKRRWGGMNVIFPRRQTVISGIGFAAIIVTTTLAYSFSGVSIVLALVLMRAGTLIMSPVIDRVFQRRIRWFSWIGMILSFVALAISLGDIEGYQLSIAVLLNLTAYLVGYALRLSSMTQIAKVGDKKVALDYFVEEQTVAMPALVLVPGVLALIGGSQVADQLRYGFGHLFSGSVAPFCWVIGFFYAALGIFLSFIYLDRRENSFCMTLFSCSSLCSGIIASYLLAWWIHGPAPNRVQMNSAFVIITALLIMSPLHHVPLYIKQLTEAITKNHLVLVKFGKPSSPVTSELSANFITINFSAIRDVIRKPRPGVTIG